MAIAACRECGAQVSTEAATCPSCGVPNPTGSAPSPPPAEKKSGGCGRGCLLAIIGFVVLVLVVGLLTTTDDGVETVSTTESSETQGAAGEPFPGLDRLGEERALQTWADLPSTPGVREIRCEPEFEICTVVFDPALWAQMEYSLKRDFVAGVGISSIAANEGIRWVEIRNSMTNDRLARYSRRNDSVTID